MSTAPHDHNHDDDHAARETPSIDPHDGDAHDHEHRHGLKGAVLAIFAPHSHDAADSIDSALESSERGIRAVKIAFAALAITSILQLAVIIASGSVALLADTIHNFSDALTAVPLFLAFRLARRPPTRRYTYGYGRAEDLAGLFVIAMIMLSAVIAAYEALSRLASPQPINHLPWVAAAGAIGFFGNELVALYRIREGNAIGSAALVADGYHARTDGFTSLAVVLGAAGVWAGFNAADPIAGLVISIAILAVLRTAVIEVFHRLLNAVDPALVDRIQHAAARAPGVRGVRQVQVRWEGHRLRADLAIRVDPALTVTQGHIIAHNVEHELLHHIAHLDGAAVHVEPDDAATDASHASIRDHH
jgi:cation diffusion facilitator family transporter